MKRILSLALLLVLTGTVRAGPFTQANVKIFDDGLLVDNSTLTWTSKFNPDGSVYYTIDGITAHFNFESTVKSASFSFGPAMDTTLAVSLIGSGAHTMSVITSNTDFTDPFDRSPVTLVNGGLYGVASIDPGNGMFATTFTTSDKIDVDVNGPYSLTNETDVTLQSGGFGLSHIAYTPGIPEPATITLFGIGIAGLLATMCRRCSYNL